MQHRSVSSAIVAVVLLATFACLVLARCLPSDRAPVSIDPLYSDPGAVPFSTVRPPDFAPSNPYTSDTAMVFYPWLAFMAREAASGDLPLWSPLCGGGLPMMGNLSSAVFFPTTWLSFVPGIGVARGMFWAALLKLVIAGVGGYFLLRRLGAGFVGAIVAGIGFSGFGYQIVWLNYSLANVSCLLPIVLWTADRFVERTSVARGASLAAVLAIQFLGGHAETSLALGIAVVTWLGCAGGMATLVRFVPYGGLSLAWCAFQLLPFVEYLGVSQGRVERLAKGDPIPMRVPAGSVSGIGLSLAVIAMIVGACRLIVRDERNVRRSIARGLVAGVLVAGCVAIWIALGGRPTAVLLLLDPDAFGSPVRDGTYLGPEMYPDVNGGYVGVALLALGMLHAFFGERRSIARFVAIGAIVGFGFASNVEPLASLMRLVPPFDLAAGTRMLPLFASAVIVGAGLAVSDLMRDGARIRRGAPRLFAAISCAGILCFALPSSRAASFSPEPENTLPRLDAPAPGSVLRPVATDRRGASLRVELRAEIEPTEASGEVGFRVGGRFFPGRVESSIDDSRRIITATWNATRAEAGIYRVAPIIGGRPEAESEFELRRDARLDVGAWLRVMLAVVVVAVVLLRPRARFLLPLVVGFELWRFGEPYNPASRIADVFPRTEITDFLERAAADSIARGEGPIRVLCEDVILQPNMNQAYGIEVVRAYDQLEFHPFRKFLAQWIVGGVPFVNYNRETVDLTHPLADFLNLAFVVTGRPLELPGFELAFESRGGAGGRIYANTDVSRRAFLASRAVNLLATTGDVARALDPRRTAFLEGFDLPANGDGSVRFIESSSNRVALEVESPGQGVLVLADNDFPGWCATVNGASVPILRTHGAFRAVQVPPGASSVVFEYAPWSIRVGAWIAALGVLAVVLAAIVSRGKGGETP